MQARQVQADLPRDHVIRALDEFVRLDDGQDVFDASAFDRVLRGYVTPSGESEPLQYLQGTRVKLPHFASSRLVSDTRAAILKVMWGVEGKTPPAMKWADVKTQVHSAPGHLMRPLVTRKQEGLPRSREVWRLLPSAPPVEVVVFSGARSGFSP